ncbi:hypothetical protein R3P38DRAFT_2764552 [Favolaschia claudopus]|uniref:Uncharacterized protein n=1 Tax=Favolaschia claudopus TaxID=2862362 RepID=A0AAW0DBY1_9AGAR
MPNGFQKSHMRIHSASQASRGKGKKSRSRGGKVSASSDSHPSPTSSTSSSSPIDVAYQLSSQEPFGPSSFPELSSASSSTPSNFISPQLPPSQGLTPHGSSRSLYSDSNQRFNTSPCLILPDPRAKPPLSMPYSPSPVIRRSPEDEVLAIFGSNLVENEAPPLHRRVADADIRRHSPQNLSLPSAAFSTPMVYSYSTELSHLGTISSYPSSRSPCHNLTLQPNSRDPSNVSTLDFVPDHLPAGSPSWISRP